MLWRMCVCSNAAWCMQASRAFLHDVCLLRWKRMILMSLRLYRGTSPILHDIYDLISSICHLNRQQGLYIIHNNIEKMDEAFGNAAAAKAALPVQDQGEQ